MLSYFKLLHFQAMICHSSSQCWGFLLAKPPPKASAESKWTSGTLGAFVFAFVTRHVSIKCNEHNNASLKQEERNAPFPTVDMLLNRQLYQHQENIFRRKLTILSFHGRFTVKTTWGLETKVCKSKINLTFVILLHSQHAILQNAASSTNDTIN